MISTASIRGFIPVRRGVAPVRVNTDCCRWKRAASRPIWKELVCSAGHSMKSPFISALLFLAIASQAVWPVTCLVPRQALTELAASRSFLQRFKTNLPRIEKFSTVNTSSYWLFLQQTPPENARKGWSTVWIYRWGRRLTSVSCPVGPGWIHCALEYIERNIGRIEKPHASPISCHIELGVPAWEPSPDGHEKRAIAKTVAHEILQSGIATEADSVVAADFNVSDPEMILRISSPNGMSDYAGCHLDPKRTPICQWHMFGQTPREFLDRTVSDHPYRISP